MYADIARRYPENVSCICIRKPNSDANDDDRFAHLFQDLPADRWIIFSDANELLCNERWLADVEETKPPMNADERR